MNKSKPEMEMPKPQQYVEERMPGGKYHDDGEAWRVMPLPMDSSRELSDDAFFRYGDGIAEHGGRLLGQPTAHIREELIGALRYAEMAEKQIAWLAGEKEFLEKELDLSLTNYDNLFDEAFKIREERDALRATCNCNCPHCTIYCEKI